MPRGWTSRHLEHISSASRRPASTLVEQPLPNGQDDALVVLSRPLAVCADESVPIRASLYGLRARYDAVNIKALQDGGLTESLADGPMQRALWDSQILVVAMVAPPLTPPTGDGAAMLLARELRGSSISMAPCAWRATAMAGCATTAA